MKSKFIPKLLTVLIDFRFQIINSIILTLFLYIIHNSIITTSDILFFSEKSQYIQFVGFISSILTLFCSLAFAFQIFIVQNLENEKNENYRLFCSLIEKLEARLQESRDRLRCEYDFRVFIEEIRDLQVEDLPLTKEELHSLTERVEEYDNDDDSKAQAPVELLNIFYLIIYRLIKFEDISTKQSLSVLYSRTIKKGFLLLILSLFLLIVAINFYSIINSGWFFYSSQVILFLLILFFFEIAWIINNYSRKFRRSLKNIRYTP